MRPLLPAFYGLLLCFALFLLGCTRDFPRTYDLDITETVVMSPEHVMAQMHRWSEARGWSNPPLSLGYEAANHFDSYEKTRLYYQYADDNITFDTLWVEDENGDPIPGDPYDLEERHSPILAKQFIGPEGYFQWRPVPEDDEKCNDLALLLQLQPEPTATRKRKDYPYFGQRSHRQTMWQKRRFRRQKPN